MARSECGYCDNRTFELAEVSPMKSNYKMYFVQCSNCGAPVGVVPFFDLATRMDEVEERVKKIEAALDIYDP